jgi:hypothetical protein
MARAAPQRMPGRHPILEIHVAEQCPRPLVRPAHPAPLATTSTRAKVAKPHQFFNSLLERFLVALNQQL